MTLETSTAREMIQRYPCSEQEMGGGLAPVGVGVHLLVEMWASPFGFLADASVIGRVLEAACGPGDGRRGPEIRLHQFSPYGVSATARGESAQVLIHTWPENEYAAVDIYARGRESAYEVLERMKAELKPGYVHVLEMRRGQLMEMEDT